MQTHDTRYDNTEYIVHGSKNGLFYDLAYFGAKVCRQVLIDKLLLQSKLNHTINWVWLRWTYTPDQPYNFIPFTFSHNKVYLPIYAQSDFLLKWS